MATQVQSAGWGYRLGRAARRASGYSRSEKQMAGWLASNGLPVALAFGAVWAIRLAIVGVLLYAAFWVALLLLFGIAAAWVAQRTDWYDDGELEWRNGHSGFGLYDKYEWRHDLDTSDLRDP